MDNCGTTDCSAGLSPGSYITWGFAAALLGISGFESSANFIEEQNAGVFGKTLRNMWLVVSIFNPLTAFLALAILPGVVPMLGEMAAGLAHEIRNPLGAISHAEQLLGESDELNAPDRRLVDIIHDNCKRMDVIIEDVLSLSRRGQSAREVVELSEWLLDFRDHFFEADDEIEAEITIAVDPAQLIVRFEIAHLRRDAGEALLVAECQAFDVVAKSRLRARNVLRPGAPRPQ